MRIDFSGVSRLLSLTLDYVEKELLNVEPYHGYRVAALCHVLGSAAGLDDATLRALTEAAVLHDCALGEYLKDELNAEVVKESGMAAHCIAGERLLSDLDFYAPVKESVLYHHERADGKGALGKRAAEVPFCARLMHAADVLDVNCHAWQATEENFASMCAWVTENTGTVIDEECAALFSRAVDLPFLRQISGEGAREYVRTLLPEKTVDVSPATLIGVCDVFAHIIDYKSHFTCTHSLGIAAGARRMGEYYGFDAETCDKLYIAGALHDIGKIMIRNEILEKPDKLTNEEYRRIQHHATGTHLLLDPIRGLEDIASWASNHHEKLDGSGYPYGKTAADLGQKERLMTCLDIYQALREDRPYKKGFSHAQAIDILRDCAARGQLDGTIVEDIDRCFGEKK